MTLTLLFRLAAKHPSIAVLVAGGKWFVVPDGNHPWGATSLGHGDTPGAAIEAAWEREHAAAIEAAWEREQAAPHPEATPPAA